MRQVGDIHVAPFEGEYHPHDGLDYKSGEVGVIGGENDLLLHEDGWQDLPEGVRSEGQMEEIAEFVKGVGL